MACSQCSFIDVLHVGYNAISNHSCMIGLMVQRLHGFILHNAVMPKSIRPIIEKWDSPVARPSTRYV